ncbi:MAG: hypothetical protein K0Q49_1040 [Haloplasmataceae bacterium]|jgi:multiple sugar transport system substrate-binding protein|nr:hypothetical protein [Haloplasmataceae bacterium]
MKKILSLIAIFVFGLVLVGCTTTTNNSTNATTKATTANTTVTSATTVATTTEPNPEATRVTFASWGVGTVETNNLVRRQVAQFNETHEDIQIDIVEYEGDWNVFLTTKAAAGEFPDVVMVGNVPEFVVKDYIGDIKDIVTEDPEWENIPQALRDSITYGDKVYAIPAAYHYLGYYANLELIEDAGDDTIFDDFTFTFDEFENAITSLKDVNLTDGQGTIGVDNPMEFINWLPSVMDTTGEISHFAWTGTNFDFNGQAIKDALAKAAEMYENGLTFASYSDVKGGTPEAQTPSDRELKFGYNWDLEAFKKNKIGFKWGANWDAAGMETDIDGLFEYDFVGLPGSKVVGVSDYYGISKSAEDKEAAYEVAKYLTFGEQGILDTFDIIDDAFENEEDANGNPLILSMSGLPINENEDIVNRWFTTIPQSGFKAAYLKAATGDVEVLMEGNKYVPGFIKARFDYNTGIDKQITRPTEPAGSTLSIGDFIWDSAQGKINYADYMTKQLNDALNYELLKAQLELSNK